MYTLCTYFLLLSWDGVKSPLDSLVLANMWKKALNLVTSQGAIQNAPYSKDKPPATPTYLVISEGNPNTFHSIKCGPSLPIIVKCSCPGFASSGICSHALAVCEKQSLLSKYLDCYNAKQTGVNLTAINLGAKEDHNVGRKKSKRCKRFKGPMPNIHVVVACERVFRVS